MSRRVLCFMALAAAVAMVPAPAAGQAQNARTAASSNATSVPKTPWGHPDLQGTWDYRTITPLERPQQYGDREFLTDAEVKDLESRAGKRMDAPPDEIRPGLTHASYWTDPGRRVTESRRTSLIVDPSNGRVPALTAEGQARADQRPDRAGTRNESWLDRPNAERCITYGLPSASLPTLYNNNIQIVQSPASVVIVHEMIHEARVVPLDVRPALPSQMRQWIGDTRGHWEGDTLVVETTNFNGRNNYRGSTTGLKLTERYTRTGPDSMEMRLTVEDPMTWTRPWTVLLPMRPSEGELIEYACHEGNLSLRNILEVARDAEKAAAKAAGAKP